MGSTTHPGNWSRAFLLCSLLLFGILLGAQVSGINIANGATSGPAFNYAVVILMENTGLGEIIGSPSAPFMNQLASTYGLATHYTAIDHPSQPNYLAMFSGLAGDCSNGGAATGGCMTGGGNSTSDCSPSSSCTMGNTTNLVDRIEAAGLTWKAYAEDLNTPCSGSDLYPSFSTVRHFPFYYFTDITGSSARCGRTFHATSPTDNEFINALGSTSTAANFMWLSPNDCNNMHSCSAANGDTYLAGIVPRILSSNIFITQKAALFVVFDEGNGIFPNDYVYALWAGPAVKLNRQSQIEFTHYSFLKTLETVWNMPALTLNDANAPSMTEFFTDGTEFQAGFMYSPSILETGQTVTLTSVVTGGTTPFGYSWSFGDGGTSIAQNPSHVYTTAGAYSVTLTVKDSSSPQRSSNISRTITIQPPPPMTADFTFNPTSPFTGETVTFIPSTSGGISPYSYSWNFGDQASGAGTPATHSYSTAGSYTAALNVSDSSGQTATSAKTIAVSVPLQPDFAIGASPSSLSVMVGDSASIAVNVSSLDGFSGTVALSGSISPQGPSISLSLSQVTLASGSSVTSTLRVSTDPRTPTDTYTVHVAGTNGSLTHSGSISLTIKAANIPLVLQVPDSMTVNPGVTLTFVVTASDPDLPVQPITLSATSLPPGASFDSETGSFSWTPSSNDVGNHTVVFTATEHGSPSLSETKTVAIQVVASSGSSCVFCRGFPLTPMSIWALTIGAVIGAVGILVFANRKSSKRSGEGGAKRVAEHVGD